MMLGHRSTKAKQGSPLSAIQAIEKIPLLAIALYLGLAIAKFCTLLECV